MTLRGRTALSVEMQTKRSVPASAAASTTLRVPKTLVETAASGWDSSRGTCLWAAAWKTTSGRKRRMVSNTALRSPMSSRTCSTGPLTRAAVS